MLMPLWYEMGSNFLISDFPQKNAFSIYIDVWRVDIKMIYLVNKLELLFYKRQMSLPFLVANLGPTVICIF